MNAEICRNSEKATSLAGLRVIALHAHPDDEALWTGGALAELSEHGAHVTVVTCTLGEEGEVIGDKYRQLTVDHADQLGGFRIGELKEALQILGVHGLHLGGAGRYRDSGMAGTSAHENPRAFVNNVESATQDFAQIICEIKPHAILTYGPDGGYGHPDHIAAHEVAHKAAALVRSAGKWDVPRIWWETTPRDKVDKALEAFSVPEGWSIADNVYLAGGTDNYWDVELALSASAFDRKRRAVAAHATQIWLADGTVSDVNPQPAYAEGRSSLAPVAFALSNLKLMPLLFTEHYQLGEGEAPAEPATVALLGYEDLKASGDTKVGR